MAGRKTYSGAAADTSLNGGITSTATTLVLTDGSTYGAPSAAAPMIIVVGPGTATEEQILISARSGNTLTVAASGRNYHLGGSGTGVAHDNAEVVKHVLDADTIDEANAHVNDDARDDHSQYLNTTRHDVTARHPTAVIADGAITTIKILDANVTLAKLASEAWTTYTPTNSNVTVGNGTEVARYQRVGRTIHVYYRLTWGSTTAFTGTVGFGLPVAPSASTGACGAGHYLDSGTQNFLFNVYTSALGASTVTPVADGGGGFSSTAPITWATSDVIQFSIIYEAAT